MVYTSTVSTMSHLLVTLLTQMLASDWSSHNFWVVEYQWYSTIEEVLLVWGVVNTD